MGVFQYVPSTLVSGDTEVRYSIKYFPTTPELPAIKSLLIVMLFIIENVKKYPIIL